MARSVVGISLPRLECSYGRRGFNGRDGPTIVGLGGRCGHSEVSGGDFTNSSGVPSPVAGCFNSKDDPCEEGGGDLTASTRMPPMGTRWFVNVGAGIIVADQRGMRDDSEICQLTIAKAEKNRGALNVERS